VTGRQSVRRVALAAAVVWAGVASGARPAALPGEPGIEPRRFIAHRGVHLRMTLAGENSLEAIRYARRAGFAAIETDVRLTSDGHAIVMHDDTLNRTCLHANGTALREKVPVARVTLAQLQSDYVLRAARPEDRTQVPTLREYLVECRRQGLLTFIEPKLYDASGRHYRDIIALADELLGAGNYVVTSNNQANRVIRNLGLRDVVLMGILYQTTFEEIAGLGNAIMAISATRFSEAEFAAHARRAVAARLPTESHADDYARFAVIDARPVDYVSTDLLAPDPLPDAAVRARRTRLEEFNSSGRIESGVLRVPAGGTVGIGSPLPKVRFGGLYFEVELAGECRVRLGGQEFLLQSDGRQRRRHQLMVHESAPAFQLVAANACEIRSLRLTLVEY
jgi:glycerophosphoryl diester phosphodiesterase